MIANKPEIEFNKNPRVSVVVLAHNHEAYIREALEGVVTQKTNFPLEVYIHDDASTDRTPEIIRDYQKIYPSLIKPIFQEENQFSKGINPLSHHIYPHLNSDYIAYCEGDDYWIDPLKLQKQVDVMDSRLEYVLCAHDIEMKYENGMAVKEVFYKKPANGNFSFTFLNEFSNHFLAIASVFVRREVAVSTPVITNLVSIEMHAFLYFLSKGNGFYLADKMAVKRRNPGGITMNKSYREKAVDGHYRMWKEVLVFAPRQYKALIRFRIAEYQRLFLKRRTFSSERTLSKLLVGAVLNNPFWLLGLSERYRRFLLYSIERKF